MSDDVPSKIIAERSFAFACRIVKLCERLWERGPAGRHLATQLLKCGTSIGANAEEAEGGQTEPDFIAKLSVSKKESRETIFWLRLAAATGLATEGPAQWELGEARQLLAMITPGIPTPQGC